ncbi:acetyl-CoA carboxylase biotin carboxyl carrier protein subunit [soil metagenome]
MKRELVVTHPAATGAQERTVVVEGPLEDGRFRFTIDGQERLVDARAVRPGTWSILLDGKHYLVDLDKRPALQGKVAASVGASEVVLSVEDAQQRKLAAAARPKGQARGETLRAPTSGKVVKVLVEVGAVVAPGTAVIVLEAMKMENELISERGGTVKVVHKQAGQAVDTGDTLIELT